MKRNTKLAIGLIAATSISAAFAAPALAHGDDDSQASGTHQKGSGGMSGGKNMMQMMQKMMRMHAKKMGGGMGNQLAKFDANGDGTVSVDEARAGLAALLKKYDTDGNGSLSLAEYQVLNTAAMREKMVDKFQALDADGDGKITSAEMAAPADRLQRMKAKWAKMKAHANGNAPAGGQSGMKAGTGSGSMTQGN